MKRTPSSARRMARSVLIAVRPTYWPTSPARSTSTRWPRRRRPIERYICASRRATVVLPVPGLPMKTRCWVVATSGRPCSLRRACTSRNATSVRTCSLTVSSPTSESSSAWSSTMLRAGSGLRSASSCSETQSAPSRPAPTRRRSLIAFRAVSSGLGMGVLYPSELLLRGGVALGRLGEGGVERAGEVGDRRVDLREALLQVPHDVLLRAPGHGRRSVDGAPSRRRAVDQVRASVARVLRPASVSELEQLGDPVGERRRCEPHRLGELGRSDRLANAEDRKSTRLNSSHLGI